MSRCFPYPPPGYTLSRATKEALIESIKLQKERVKAKEQKKKKEKRREKKEKRKEKKDKTNQNLDKSDVVQGHIGEKFWADTKGEFLCKGSKAEPEQLEKSSLTEEHGKPVCLRVPSSSSDSTENSNKRKRLSSPIDGTRGNGKIIRIRLPSKKQNQSDASANEQQLCSTSGRTHFPSQNKDDTGLRRRSEDFCCTSEGTSNIGQGLVRRTDKEQISLTSQLIKTVAAGKTQIPSANDAVMTSMQREELQYKNLIENWVPPQWQDATPDTDDLDWLFQGKNQDIRAKKRQISGNDSISCSSSSALWPCAQYLQEVDVFALPFTVPF
ncbi:hypothetical protein Pfo_021472 [Paulownia fortunei]|nr:hypothetical protein Pfo_021472 [Paulownia fortunei]